MYPCIEDYEDMYVYMYVYIYIHTYIYIYMYMLLQVASRRAKTGSKKERITIILLLRIIND